MNDIFNNDEKLKKSQADEKQRKQREISDLKFILSKPQGRRFIWKLLSDCHMFQISFSQNAMQIAFTEGERNIGLKVLAWLNESDTHIFAQMQEEYLAELKSKKDIEEAKKETPKQEE